jgi:formylglycine-generating enzyme required for sulfatase activity
MDFAFVPAGTFLQGSPGATNQERPYTATLTRNYFVSRTEVTQGQWKAATGGVNPSCFQSGSGPECSTANANDDGPVEQVDWYSAIAYANWLSANEGLSACYTFRDCTDATSDWYDGTHPSCTNATFTGLDCTGYRLLIESEWERAVRGGTTSTYFWGEATDTATIGIYAWFIGNSLNRTQLVGGKLVNPYGLHDMSGNVSEWLFDCIFSTTFTSYPVDSATDYIEPRSALSCAIRGGRWSDSASGLRSGSRAANRRSTPNRFIGFRLARTAY